jgi:hypothetical protein
MKKSFYLQLKEVKIKMSNSDKINKWINDQLENGKTEDELNGKVFYDNNDTYTINKSGKKFNLKVKFGNGVNLESI